MKNIKKLSLYIIIGIALILLFSCDTEKNNEENSLNNNYQKESDNSSQIEKDDTYNKI